MGYLRAPAAGLAAQPCDDQRVQAKPFLVDDHLNAAAIEFGQEWHRVIERIDQHLVATAQQISRQDHKLPFGAAYSEAADNVEDAQNHLGIVSVAHPAHVPHLESEQQPQLLLHQTIACPETCQQAPDELTVKEALRGDQARLDILVDQY